MNKTIYKQADSRWGNLPYPTKSYKFSGNGCGCCAVCHCAIQQDKCKKLTPADVRKYMVQFATQGHGTLWSGIKKGLEHYGFKVHWNQGDSMSDIFKVLEASPLKCGVILFGSSLGGSQKVCWTKSGHYVAFCDAKKDKNGDWLFYTMDSGGRNNSGWHSYKKTMKGDVRQVWICTGIKDEKIEPIKKPTGKYSGTIPSGTIRFADEGTKVKALQKFLTWYGIKLTADGKCGAKTVRAIKVFQATEGLTTDGVYGSKSYVKAKAYKAASENPQGPKIVDLSGLKKVIDISYWQAVADLKKAKKEAGVDGVIIRTSYTSQDSFSLHTDSRFKSHIQSAIEAGLPIGVYHYSQALSESEAKKEAEYVLKIIKPYKQYINMPVVMDFEFGGRLNSTSAKKLGKTGVDKVISKFCQTVIDAGYTAMLYANLSTLQYYMTYSKMRSRFLIWLAQYSSKPSIKDYDLWQYTSKGKITGVSGNVDVSKGGRPQCVDDAGKTYTGKLPDWILLSANLITMKGKELAYPKGTKSSVYTYGKGKATDAFTAAINRVFAKRSSWSKQCQAGASCDVGSAVVLRDSGADPKVPRGLAQQFPYMAKSSRFKEVLGITEGKKMRAGDVGMWLNKGGGGHIWICIGDGKIVEANHTAKFFLHVDTDNYRSAGRKEYHCYRICVPIRKYIQKGDAGSEIEKLQTFLNWYGNYNLKVDGKCGAKTEAAIKDFQDKEKLNNDGKFGTACLARSKQIKK